MIKENVLKMIDNYVDNYKIEDKEFFKLDESILISGTHEIENMEQDHKLERVS